MATPSNEGAAVRALIRAVRADGWVMTVVDDGGDEDEIIPVRTEGEALEAIFAVDEAYLYFTRSGERAWIRFVLGNEPEEVACDYTVNLSDAIDPVTDKWWS